MVSVGKDSRDHASSNSWWWDSHNRPHQSLWLQTTLSDLDEKTKMMLSLVQEDGDSFAKRAEMYYKKRPELIKMVEDTHKSYRSLAERYDQLRSESFPGAHSRRFSNSTKQVQRLQNTCKENPENTIVEAPNSHLEIDAFSSDFECLNSLKNELISTDSIKNQKKQEYERNCNKEGIDKKIQVVKFDNDKRAGFRMHSLEKEQMWNELRLKVSKLMEENLQQQAELIRRNDEKRKVIKDLCLHINRLEDENRALKSSLAKYEVDVNQTQSQMSRMKEVLFGKFLR